MARRVGIRVASALLLIALAYPAVAPGELDSLPLSNYPMFAHERNRVARFHGVFAFMAISFPYQLFGIAYLAFVRPEMWERRLRSRAELVRRPWAAARDVPLL